MAPAPPCTLLIGVILSTSLLDLSTLFGGGRRGIWVEEGFNFKLHAHYCLKKRGLKLALDVRKTTTKIDRASQLIFSMIVVFKKRSPEKKNGSLSERNYILFAFLGAAAPMRSGNCFARWCLWDINTHVCQIDYTHVWSWVQQRPHRLHCVMNVKQVLFFYPIAGERGAAFTIPYKQMSYRHSTVCHFGTNATLSEDLNPCAPFLKMTKLSVIHSHHLSHKKWLYVWTRHDTLFWIQLNTK